MKKPTLSGIASSIFPTFFFVTTIIGAIRWFSPVPFWDMWDGTLAFNLAINQGRWSAFFEQANEHRIVLAKILFLIDYRFFGGLSYFLIVVNIVLMTGLWVVLAVTARRLTEPRTARLLTCIAGVLCFSWLQAENINWGYQSQFYMAYLLPLLAMLAMARYIASQRTGWFCLSAALGAASTLTMANGLSALPILVSMLLLYGRQFRTRTVVLVGITVITTALFFRHYQVQQHPIASPRAMIAFVLTFFGAPFAHVFQCQRLTFLVGTSCVVAVAFAVIKISIDRTRDPVALALAAFTLHIAAAGAAAALGRADLGLGAATAGRYETPVLVLYASLAIIFAHFWRNRAETKGSVATGLVAISIVLLASQLGALSTEGAQIARQRLQGALALALGIHDNERLGALYPVETPEQRHNLWATAHAAMDANLSVFSLPSFHIVRVALGKTPPAGYRECQGYIDRLSSIPTDARYERIDGWAFNQRTHRTPATVLLVEHGIVVGTALTGTRRPDVAKIVNRSAIHAGFEGYAYEGSERTATLFCAD